MKINFSHIHSNTDWNDTIKVIKAFMEVKGFESIMPEEFIPEISGVDYNNIENKTLRFFILTKSKNNWTGIFEDGEIPAEKELAKFISQELNGKTIWTICSTSLNNYLYTVFENGKLSEELARGDLYDYDNNGQLKYYNCYNPEELISFLNSLGINTSVVTYEQIMSNFKVLNLEKDDLIHIAFKKIIKPEKISIKEDIFKEDIFKEDIFEEKEEKPGLFKKMMDRLTQPIWDKLGNDMTKVLPFIQKAQEMSQLAMPLVQSGLKGEELRYHPDYQRLMKLEKELTEEIKKSPYYTDEMEGILKQGMGLTQKVLKPYDPIEEEIRNLNICEVKDYINMAHRGKKILELSSGITLDWSEKGIKRLDKSISWTGIPQKADQKKFRLSIGFLIGELLIKVCGGEWIEADEPDNFLVKIRNLEINPFKWYEEKISAREPNNLIIYKKFQTILSQ